VFTISLLQQLEGSILFSESSIGEREALCAESGRPHRCRADTDFAPGLEAHVYQRLSEYWRGTGNKGWQALVARKLFGFEHFAMVELLRRTVIVWI
jgi:hypothetical protein